jgi:hypothetical protein
MNTSSTEIKLIKDDLIFFIFNNIQNSLPCNRTPYLINEKIIHKAFWIRSYSKKKVLVEMVSNPKINRIGKAFQMYKLFSMSRRNYLSFSQLYFTKKKSCITRSQTIMYFSFAIIILHLKYICFFTIPCYKRLYFQKNFKYSLHNIPRLVGRILKCLVRSLLL